MRPRYVLEIPGTAIPKGRPRAGRGRVYTPGRTRDWEEYVGWLFVSQFGRPLLEGAITVDITIGGRPRGDVDNLAKSILDALNGIAYRDDSQVLELRVRKTPGGVPGVLVQLQEWVRDVTVAAATAGARP